MEEDEEELAAGLAAGGGVELVLALLVVAPLPLPVRLAEPPAACILAIASASVSQVIDVPRLLTRGRATHCVPAAHAVRANLPDTH